jgi:cytosine/adenosine deaminase-related metal-dependent hydrolase
MMPSMSLLIRDATVITVDPERRVLDPGAVYVEGARIADAGPSAEVVRRHPQADRVVDGRRKVVIPGFVSTHTHVGYTLFRGRAEDAGLACVTGQYFPMSTVVTRDERLAIGSLTYAELLRSGVTTVLEMEEDADVYAPFVERLGIRSSMGVMLHDVPVEDLRRGQYRFDPALAEAQLRQAIGFAESWHGRAEGRITALMTPNMTISSSPAQLRAAREAADRLGLRLSIHLGWGPSEVVTTRRLHGQSPFEYASAHGLLRPDVVAAHCYVIDDADLALLARSGARVAHCPLMNAVRGHIAPVQDLLARGVTVSLGIDNMFADFFDVVRTAVLVARIRARDAVTMLSMQAIELATLGGARALGMEREIGSIEPGKRADLVVLDYRAFGLTPTLDPVQNLVYHAHARDVEMVLVDGRVVVDGRRVATVDAEALIDPAQDAATAAWSRFVAKYGGILAT